MKISVIIPAFNCEKYITQTLDIIRTQTLDGIEAIVYLDGCSDNSPKIVSEYKKKWPKMNLTVIDCAENHGVSYARNSAIAAARGEFLHFMDADDIVSPDFYQNLYDAAMRTGADVAVSGYYNERYPAESVMFHMEQVLSNPQDKIDATYVDMSGFPWRYLIRREFWTAHEFSFPLDLNYCEDMLVMNKVVYHSNYIVTVPSAVYLYKHRANSLLTTKSVFKSAERNVAHDRAEKSVHEFLAAHGLERTGYPTNLKIVFILGIPLLFIRRRGNGRTKVYLFDKIPLMKIRYKTLKK